MVAITVHHTITVAVAVAITMVAVLTESTVTTDLLLKNKSLNPSVFSEKKTEGFLCIANPA